MIQLTNKDGIEIITGASDVENKKRNAFYEGFQQC